MLRPIGTGGEIDKPDITRSLIPAILCADYALLIMRNSSWYANIAVAYASAVKSELCAYYAIADPRYPYYGHVPITWIFAYGHVPITWYYSYGHVPK